jgi:hypothetical protein
VIEPGEELPEDNDESVPQSADEEPESNEGDLIEEDTMHDVTWIGGEWIEQEAGDAIEAYLLGSEDRVDEQLPAASRHDSNN